MTKEQTYRQQMEHLGTWDPAFEGAVHDLCMLERDQAKVRTAWRDALRSSDTKAASALMDTLIAQDRSIQALRDSLGLTPAGLKKLRPGGQPPAGGTHQELTVLDKIRARREA